MTTFQHEVLIFIEVVMKMREDQGAHFLLWSLRD